MVENLSIMRKMQEVWVPIPGLGRSPGGGNSNPLQCSRLEDPRDRGAWLALKLRSIRCQELDTTEVTSHTRIH